jgi:hypothetical protein
MSKTNGGESRWARCISSYYSTCPQPSPQTLEIEQILLVVAVFATLRVEQKFLVLHSAESIRFSAPSDVIAITRQAPKIVRSDHTIKRYRLRVVNSACYLCDLSLEPDLRVQGNKRKSSRSRWSVASPRHGLQSTSCAM